MNKFNKSPYRQIPKELLPGYTQGHKIPIQLWWFDSTTGSTALETPDWNDEYIKKFQKDFSLEKIKNDDVSENYQRDKGARTNLQAFEKYGIRGKNVAVVGTTHPWVEAILLNLNNKVTTVEYNVPKSNMITCISYDQFVASNVEYDCIVSYSSVEHSGLGRYGDPLDPDGDLKTMKEIHKHLKSTGLCILGIPVGRDCLVWNAHRIYGRTRLPLLLDGFQDLEWFGYNQSLLDYPLHIDALQPVLVLRKPGESRPFANHLNNVLVESGSFKGDGIAAGLKAGFKRVISYEISPQLYSAVSKRFEMAANVSVYQKPSQTMFEEIKDIAEPMTFWLDGHYMTDNAESSFYQLYCPVLFELDEIARHPIKTHTILVNGVHFFGKWDYQFITEKEVTDKILTINPNYQFTHEDDVLVATVPQPKVGDKEAKTDKEAKACPTCHRPL